MQLQNQADGLNYYDNLKLYHRTLVKQGVGVDVIDWKADLSGYKVVVAPHLYLLDEANAARLEAYVRAGGTLILTPRTGVKDMENVCVMRPLPGPLANCAGIVVEEYDPVGRDVHHIEFGGKTYECRQWCDILQPTTASAVGTYTDDFYAGKPAITLNRLESGQVYYIGTGLDDAFYTDFWQRIISECGLTALPGVPEGIHVSTRSSDQAAYLFVLNLSRESRSITLPKEYRSILSNKAVGPSLELAPYGVEILTAQAAQQ
jgi:beta-galactosidase